MHRPGSVKEVICSDCGLESLTDPCYYCEELARVSVAPVHPISGIPSTVQHRLYLVEEELCFDYDGPGIIEHRRTVTDPNEARLVSSEISPSDTRLHAPVLDIDFHAALIPSSSPGHYHLYLDKEMSWRRYKRLLRALRRAGILEPGYVKASIRRKHTALRVPWLRKEGSANGHGS